MRLLNFFLFIIISTPLQSQWNFTDGPYGGKVNLMVSKNNYVFAATALAGLNVTANGGQLWAGANDGLPTDDFITALAIKGNFIFAGTQASGVYRSSNDGGAWVAKNLGFSTSTLLSAMSMSVDENKLIAAMADGVYISFNNADTWIKISSGLNGIPLISTAIKGDTLFAGSFFSGLYRSVNLGSTWEHVEAFPANYTAVSQIFVGDSFILAGVSDDIFSSSRIYRANHSGAAWVNVQDLPGGNVSSFTESENIIYAATTAGIYRSTDNGHSWEAMNNGLGYTVMSSIVANNQGLFASASLDGVFKWNDQQSIWEQMNNGLYNVKSLSLETSQGKVFMGTLGGGIQIKKGDIVWKSSNAGIKDLLIPILNPGTFEKVYAIEVVDSNVVLMGFGRSIYISHDFGQSWEKTEGTGINEVYSIFEHNGIFYAGTDAGVLKSDDLGTNWTPSNTGVGDDIRTFEYVDNFLFAGGEGVFLSFNDGGNWASVGESLMGTTYDLTLIDTVLYAASRNGLFRTTDLGVHWDDLGFSNVRSVEYDSESIIIATEFDRMYRSTPGGNWVEMNEGLPSNLTVFDLALDGDTLYLASENRGVWKLNLNDVVTGTTAIASNDILLYPNPVNNRLYIDGVNVPSFIQIIDQEGRIVDQLQLKGNSIETISWPTGNLWIYILDKGERVVKSVSKQ